MKMTLIAALIMGLAGAFATPVLAEGPGSCGSKKVWSPAKGKCVPKPRTGSGSH